MAKKKAVKKKTEKTEAKKPQTAAKKQSNQSVQAPYQK